MPYDDSSLEALIANALDWHPGGGHYTDDDAATFRKLKAQRDEFIAVLRRVRLSIDVSLIRSSAKAQAHWADLADSVNAVLAKVTP